MTPPVAFGLHMHRSLVITGLRLCRTILRAQVCPEVCLQGAVAEALQAQATEKWAVWNRFADDHIGIPNAAK